MSERDPDDRTALTLRKRPEREPRASKEVETETSTGLGALPKEKVDASRHWIPKKGRRRRRYRLRKILGRGGMGEIHLARDQRVGRSVALKLLLEEATARPDALWRFFREARVQGQLEHPAIVPVYDIGWDRSGRAYFAMKRIGGVTLRDIVRELRAGSPETEAKYSLRRLLSIFQQVCLAIDYAHARGVIHRDIKPTNVMVGDFGEVYVLDWGIAKLVEGEDSEARVRTPASDDEATGQGEVLGTLGYMAPEQITSATTVDARADVYSLGALLFHLLTLEPLHGRGSVTERARSTQEGVDARASVRAPHRDVPPELDAICVKATALDRRDRLASARALHDQIERFLEGDRDLRLRTELAEQHVAKAKEASKHALGGGPSAEEQRRIAVREAGRALALDPKSEAAAAIVARLMLEPPKELPQEVRAKTRAIFHSEVQRGARLGTLALFGIALNALSLVALGVRSWLGLAAIVVPLLCAGLFAAFSSHSAPHELPRRVAMLSLLICLAIAGASGLVGGLFLAPLYALGFAVVATVLHGLGRQRIAMIGLACASWLVPALLEWAGVLPPTYRFDGSSITVLPLITAVPETATRIALVTANLATIVFICALLWRVGAAIAESRERVQLHAWHLEQLAPDSREPRSEARAPEADHRPEGERDRSPR